MIFAEKFKKSKIHQNDTISVLNFKNASKIYVENNNFFIKEEKG